MCFHPCWESSQIHMHAQTCMKTGEHTLADQCALSFCVCVYNTHTHTRTDEFTGGQAGGLAWAEMNTCWDQSSSVWFTFLSLSVFLSIACFLLSLDTPLPPLLALFSPLNLWKPAVEDVFSPKIHERKLDICFVSFKGSMVLGLNPTFSFLFLSFFNCHSRYTYTV